ncbi:MAG: hypothetical protein RR646_06355 [Erysipelotrichaceae bacterium]
MKKHKILTLLYIILITISIIATITNISTSNYTKLYNSLNYNNINYGIVNSKNPPLATLCNIYNLNPKNIISYDIRTSQLSLDIHEIVIVETNNTSHIVKGFTDYLEFKKSSNTNNSSIISIYSSAKILKYNNFVVLLIGDNVDELLLYVNDIFL